MEKKLAHLGFIQGIITRVGGNSFLIKGWSVTLVAAIFALAAKDSNAHFAYLAFFPVFVFWGLDAFFFRQEKMYRHLYDAVATDVINSNSFTLDATSFGKKSPSWVKSALSKTLLPYYGTMVILIFAFMWKVLGIIPTK